jgi:hypothetical protein
MLKRVFADFHTFSSLQKNKICYAFAEIMLNLVRASGYQYIWLSGKAKVGY